MQIALLQRSLGGDAPPGFSRAIGSQKNRPSMSRSPQAVYNRDRSPLYFLLQRRWMGLAGPTK